MAAPLEFGFLDELVSISFPSGGAILWVTTAGATAQVSGNKGSQTCQFVPTNFSSPTLKLVNNFNPVAATGKFKHSIWSGPAVIDNFIPPLGIDVITRVQNYAAISKSTKGPSTFDFEATGQQTGSAGIIYGWCALVAYKNFKAIKMVPGGNNTRTETLHVTTNKGVSVIGWNGAGTALIHQSGPSPDGFAQEIITPSSGGSLNVNFATYTPAKNAVTLA